MNRYNIIIRAYSFQVLNSFQNGFLEICPAFHNPLDFRQPILPANVPHLVKIAFDAHDLNRVNFRMLLENIKRVSNNRLSKHLSKLFWYIQPKSNSFSSGENNGNIHNAFPLQ